MPLDERAAHAWTTDKAEAFTMTLRTAWLLCLDAAERASDPAEARGARTCAEVFAALAEMEPREAARRMARTLRERKAREARGR